MPAFGSFNLTMNVWSSGASNDCTDAYPERFGLLNDSGIIESNVYFRSFAVTGRPSWNFAFGLRWKTIVLSSGVSHLSARSPVKSPVGVSLITPLAAMSQIRPSFAFVPTRGSRFAGELSNAITSVSLSPAAAFFSPPPPHPASSATHTRIMNFRILHSAARYHPEARRRRRTRRSSCWLQRSFTVCAAQDDTLIYKYDADACARPLSVCSQRLSRSS